MKRLVLCVEVVEQGGVDHAVTHASFAQVECPPDPWLDKFLCGDLSEEDALAEWRQDIIRQFPLDISDSTARRFANLPQGDYGNRARVSGLLKWDNGYRWEPANSQMHEGVMAIGADRCGEGCVIGSAWFELEREIQQRSAQEGVQPPTMWCILAVGGMIDRLRASGMRPRVVFWMEEYHV